MSFEIYATKRFLKEFKKLDSEVQKRIKNKIAELKENPTLGIPLTAQFKGKWKLRIGNYRIIYEIDYKANRIFLLAIGHRENVYDREGFN